MVEKVAAGGLEHVKVVRAGNIAQALRRLKEEGFWIYGAAGEAGADDLYRVDFAARAVLVLGEEHEGLRRLTRELCDRLVRIPSTGVIDSFNLGTASGIILARIYAERQPRSAKKSRNHRVNVGLDIPTRVAIITRLGLWMEECVYWTWAGRCSSIGRATDL